MSPPRPARPPVAIGETLAKLTEMLDEVGGTVDRDRRRVAARLSELVRSADDELPRFAGRHLPGRDVDAEALKEARELAVELARLVGMVGEAPGAAAALRELREAACRRREALERGEAPADVPPRRSSAPPPTMPAPPVSPSLPTFMQSPGAAGFPGFVAPAPPAVVPPPTFVPPGGSPIAPPPRFAIADERTEAADAPPPERPTPLPFASPAPPAPLPFASPAPPAPLPFAPPAPPAPGAADPPAKPAAPATGLPFTRDPQRRG